MFPRRLSLALVVPAGLVVLVGVLAYFQYQWLGQVSEAERARLRSTLSQRARDFSDDFDRDLSRAYTALTVTPDAVASKSWAAFADKYDTWKEAARFPQVIRNIYIAPTPGAATLLQFDPGGRTFVDAAWPEELAPVRERVASFREHALPSMPQPRAGGPATFSFVSFGMSPLFADVPALVSAGPTPVIIELNRDYLRETVLPALVERHFGADDYRVQVIDPGTPKAPLYSRGVAADGRIDAVNADIAMPFFSVRFDTTRDVVASLRPAVPAATASGSIATGRFSIVIDERSSQTPLAVTQGIKAAEIGAKAANVFADKVQTVSMMGGAWQLLLQHPAGSLDAAVAQARRRNLSLSFGVLAVLAVSVVMVSVTAQRSRRLAAQQMDFVATVSHELRTPLAVIRSAAQNLSAGVVTDATQAKRYGDLIDGEGRRLTDMVEQVLEYAGADHTVRPEEVGPVDVAALVADSVRAAEPLLTEAGLTVDVRVPDGLPAVQGDAAALRRALTNLIGNAAKYGRDGQWVGLTVERRDGRAPEVAVTVADKGVGIAASDLPHIFEAFYRGQYAKERQIHGNGLGLSLVKRIADAHGGKVTVKSSPGEGAAFTLHLPTVPAS